MMSPGPIFEPEGHGGDWWGCARACSPPASARATSCTTAFAYHLTPGAFILESGAQALGCAVIPGGVGNTEQQIEAIAHLKPAGYIGTPDFLKILLDAAAKAGKDVVVDQARAGLRRGAAGVAARRSWRRAASPCCNATPSPSRRDRLRERGARGHDRQRASDRRDRPARHRRSGADGEVGEVVVTSFNPDYPMIRLATGDLSAVLPGVSPCGRTNMRIKGWMGRADQTTKVKGMFVRPEQVAEVAKRHAALGRVRLVVTRDGRAGRDDADGRMRARRRRRWPRRSPRRLQSVTKLHGEVKLVAPGSLPNDGKVIADERPVG